MGVLLQLKFNLLFRSPYLFLDSILSFFHHLYTVFSPWPVLDAWRQLCVCVHRGDVFGVRDVR